MTEETADFLEDHVMAGKDPRELELSVVRVLAHCGWHGVQDVAGPGEKGADVLAVREPSDADGYETWLVQTKAKQGSGLVGVAAIEQAIDGQARYGTKHAVVATNSDFTHSAIRRAEELTKAGFHTHLWNGAFLRSLLREWDLFSPSHKTLRTEYQEPIVEAIVSSHKQGGSKSLFIVATGLGKTLIAAEAANRLRELGLARVLVLCHSRDLALQLQRAFWEQIPKSVPTRLFMEGKAPVSMPGINFGLYQSLYNNLQSINPTAFDLIIVDEAHHALGHNFHACLNHLKPKHLIGMTATPWRGDGLQVESLFGPPLSLSDERHAKISLVDGMRMGHLARVDYRLMCDNVDWEEVRRQTREPLSIKDLNKRLFLPQRDEAVIATLTKAMEGVSNPRIAVFSPSCAHADRFARMLCSAGIPAANVSIKDKFQRRKTLIQFSSGALRAVTAVDVLNEGIDVPALNILVFLRATHSRRIFVQQLGRGLRVADGKESVVVLDFVTDIRRIAEIMDIDREAKTGAASGPENVHLRDGVVTFSSEKKREFLDEWLADVANLQDADDEEKLVYPGTD